MSDATDPAPFRIPAQYVRYAVALEPAELGWGYTAGWLSPEDTVTLAFLRRCDLGKDAGAAFERIDKAKESAPDVDALCRQLASERDDSARIWEYLAASWPDSPLASASTYALTAAGREEFLLARATSGRGMNWSESSALLGTDRPEEVDAAFARGEELVGVAVIGLALTHPDAEAILPRVARALEPTNDKGLRHQGVVALAHVARLHGTVDDHCLNLLRGYPRGNEADNDLWGYVAHRRLPLWLWRHHIPKQLTWLLRDKWRG